MKKEDNKIILLENNYNKLLAYLGGSLISFFTLYQITVEPNINPYLAMLISVSMLLGVSYLMIAAFLNWNEIITLYVWYRAPCLYCRLIEGIS